MSIQAVDLGLLWIGAAGSVASLAVYGLSARWWRNQLGRFLVVYMAVVVLVYAKSVIGIVAGGELKATPVNLAVNGLVAGLMVYQTWTYAHLIVKARRKRRTRP